MFLKVWEQSWIDVFLDKKYKSLRIPYPYNIVNLMMFTIRGKCLLNKLMIDCIT